MPVPEIELLWWEGCPSTDTVLAQLREALQDLGIEDAVVRTREIRTDAGAQAAGFVGSPTILIDGIDVDGASADEPSALNCRVYRLRDGRISPTPDPDDLRDALAKAAGRPEAPRLEVSR